MKFLSKIISATLCAFLFYSCQETKKPQTIDYLNIQGEAQGTTYSITYKDSLSRNFKPSIDSILKQIDLSVSTYVDSSLISKFNVLTDTVPFEIDQIFYDNLLVSSKVYEQTNGIFDPTITPLFKYYNFHNNDSLKIDSVQVDSILRNHVGFSKLMFFTKNKTYFVKKQTPSIQLDFNAVAQGYSVDVIGAFLEKNGVKNFMVELGGEVLAKGKNPNRKTWNIGIEKPNFNSEKTDDAVSVVKLENKALATSGSYRKFKELNGKKYAHAINPITGMPVSHSVLSVSVIANTCAEADAYATAFLILGKEASLNLIKKINLNVEVYFIETSEEGNFKEYKSEGF
ncbi:MAG: FAD:protein FMN transferase [Bacteroidia bacterium]